MTRLQRIAKGIERIAPKSRLIHKLQENTSYCPRIGVQLRSVRSQNAIPQNPGNPDPTGRRTQSNWIAIGLQYCKGLQGDWSHCIKIAQFAGRLQQLRASKRDLSTAIQPIFGHSRTRIMQFLSNFISPSQSWNNQQNPDQSVCEMPELSPIR